MEEQLDLGTDHFLNKGVCSGLPVEYGSNSEPSVCGVSGWQIRSDSKTYLSRYDFIFLNRLPCFACFEMSMVNYLNNCHGFEGEAAGRVIAFLIRD